MKRHIKILAAIVSLTSLNTANAGGCGGHGGISVGFGGGGISIGRAHAPRMPHAPSSHTYPSAPVYSQPSRPPMYPPFQSQPSNFPPMEYQQPTYSQSSYPHGSSYSNGGYSQPMHQSQGNSMPQGPAMQSSNMSSQQGMPSQNNAGYNNNNMPQQAPSASMAAQPQMRTTQPVQAGQNGSQGNMAPNPGASLASGAELSALQILASIDGGNLGSIENAPNLENVPEAAVTAMQLPAGHFGNWVVSLPGNQMIKLALNQDNSFMWLAIKDGKESSFQGQYRMEGQRLILVRSSDLQQMAGSWNGEGSNFTFKLDGSADSGLPFARGQ